MQKYFDLSTYKTLLQFSKGWDEINYILINSQHRLDQDTTELELVSFKTYLYNMGVTYLILSLEDAYNKWLGDQPIVNSFVNNSNNLYTISIKTNYQSGVSNTTPTQIPLYYYKTLDDVLDSNNFSGIMIHNMLALNLRNEKSPYPDGEFFLMRDSNRTFLQSDICGILVTECGYFKLYQFSRSLHTVVITTSSIAKIVKFTDFNGIQFIKNDGNSINITLNNL